MNYLTNQRLLLSLIFITTLQVSWGQTGSFDSGSTGADEDLIFDINNGVDQVFDHLKDGHDDGIWNFGTIVIPEGVTVRFSNPLANGTPPVVFLATGDVLIQGNLVLDGNNGSNRSGSDNVGEEAKGGPGGFAGGLNKGDGYGPGGGRLRIQTQFDVNGRTGQYSGIYGNRQLQPLIGGSGGGGGFTVQVGAGGGGGGGAILISSSTTIEISGVVSCNGGFGGDTGPNNGGKARGGQGSGGAIRLVANQIKGNGTLSAAPGGRIALEAFDVLEMHLGTNPATYYLNLNPSETFSMPEPTILITTIDGQSVAAPSLGRTEIPDAVFSNTGEVTVNLECANIPVGTTLTVTAKLSDNNGSQTFSSVSTPLAGTLEQSIATAMLTLPQGPGGTLSGLGRGVIHAYANWDE